MMTNNEVEIEKTDLTVDTIDGVEITVEETVSPYGAMMAALKEYIDSVIESMTGLSVVVFCETLPEKGYGDHLYICTSEAVAYIWKEDAWVALSGNVPTYTGETNVRPMVAEAQTLETAGYKLNDDVTVEKIPVSDIENDKGGKTVTIG